MVFFAVAMGVGRFAYTPLIPVMEHDAGLSIVMAGLLATTNLIGYFVGASLAMHPAIQAKRLAVVRWSLAGVVVTTALMALPPQAWLLLRFLTGACSGFAFVFTASIALERAARLGRPSLAPVVFMGVGLGIAFSGVAVPALALHGGSRAAWIGMAAIAALALFVTGSWFDDDSPPTRAAHAAAADSPASRDGATFRWLCAVYTAEAFVYIIPATFLVAIIAKMPGLAQYASLTWVFVGLAAAFATFAWIRASVRAGKARLLAIGFAIQAIGIGAPVFSHSAFAVIFAGVALGGTFIAMTFFASGIGRDIFPRQTSTAVGRLTAFYSIGQIVGPLVATRLAQQSGSYTAALLAAAIVAALAAVVTLVTVRDYRS